MLAVRVADRKVPISGADVEWPRLKTTLQRVVVLESCVQTEDVTNLKGGTVVHHEVAAAPHMVKIEDASQTLIAVVLANEIPGRSAGAGQIIFHCYSYSCFLSELRSPIQGNGRQLLTSRAEAALAKKERGRYFAVLGDKPRP
jgi:hypothetical protein